MVVTREWNGGYAGMEWWLRGNRMVVTREWRLRRDGVGIVVGVASCGCGMLLLRYFENKGYARMEWRLRENGMEATREWRLRGNGSYVGMVVTREWRLLVFHSSFFI